MKQIVKWFLFSLCIIVLSSCANEPTKNDELSSYSLSYTTTTKDLVLSNSIYDFENDTTKELLQIKLDAKYSLTVYDDYANQVLYTKDDGTNNNQIYAIDIKTQEEKKLTTNLYGVNYIIPRKNDILVVAIGKGDHFISLWSIDRQTMEMEKISIPDQPSDMNIFTVAFNPDDESIVFEAYSEEERSKKMNTWNKLDPSKAKTTELEFDTYFYRYKDNVELLFEKTMPQSLQLIANKNIVLYSVDNDTKEQECFYYDINEKTEKKIDSDTIKNIGKIIKLSDDNQYIYSVSDNKIFQTNIDTNEKSALEQYHLQIDEYMNNCLLIKK